MARDLRNASNSADTFFVVGTLAVVGAMLYVASAVVLPLALAILLTAVLSPAVRRVERAGVRPAVAASLVSLLVAAFLLGGTFLAGRQLVQVIGQLPKYRANIHSKLATLKEVARPAIAWSHRVLGEFGKVDASDGGESIDLPTSIDSGQSAIQATARVPMAVQIVDTTPAGLALARQILAPAIAPAATASIVFVLTVFMLISREDLRNRLIVLLGVDRVPGTTQLLEEAWHRVSKYLRMQLALNCGFGVAVFAITWGVGLPNAPLWGLLAAVLRFIPFLGPLLAAGLPLAIAVAVSDGWLPVIALAALFVVVELVMNNVLEPWFYGASAGVSAVGIVVSVLFWTWLWGPVGLVLATPLTVCLTVVGRNVPALRFWATLLADESPLSSTDRLFQRLLAGDDYEALRIIEQECHGENSDVLAQLGLLEAAVSRAAMEQGIGVMDNLHVATFQRTFDAVWDEVRAEADVDAPSPPSSHCPRLAVLPARGALDRQLAQLAAVATALDGWHVRLAEQSLLTHDMAEQVCKFDSDVVVVVAAGPRATAHARYACRQFRALGWSGTLAVLLKQREGVSKEQAIQFEESGAQEVAATLADLARQIQPYHHRAALGHTMPAEHVGMNGV